MQIVVEDRQAAQVAYEARRFGRFMRSRVARRLNKLFGQIAQERKDGVQTYKAAHVDLGKGRRDY